MKPKRGQASDITTSSTRDQCQTPPYAINPLLPYIEQFKKPECTIWESAAGDGILVKALRDHGYWVKKTDILTGQNFFVIRPPAGAYVQITNPPYSIQYEWLKRSYEIGLPFALLMPVDVMGAKRAQRLFDKHGIEIICLDQRIDFKMPEKGWNGAGAQFTTFWYTWGLGIGRQLTFARLNKPIKQRLAEMVLGYEQLQLFG